MGRPIAAVGFDADDTLWRSEDHFHDAEAMFVDAVSSYADEPEARAMLARTERTNLDVLGYGAKPFTISMVEAAIEISEGTIDPATLRRIITTGKALLTHPVDLLPDAARVVTEVAARWPVLLITKGDLGHQQRKIADSGLEPLFAAVHVVHEKDVRTYGRILSAHEIDPAGFVMVGNSVKSDLVPVLEIGGRGVHIPYHVTWILERATTDASYIEIETLAELSGALDGMAA